jgi:hypothetical protein
MSRIGVNATIRDLMDVARVSIMPSMPQLDEHRARALLLLMLDMVDTRNAGGPANAGQESCRGKERAQIVGSGATAHSSCRA